MLGAARTAWDARAWTRSNVPGGQVVVNSTINYAYQQYSNSTLTYVGADTSSRPVFYFAYANSSNLLRAILFRIEDNGAITFGSEQSAGSISVYRTVQSMSDYEGANSFGNGTPSGYVYMCYIDSTLSAGYIKTAFPDVNSLTCTFGTAVAITGTPDADQPVVAYVGNDRAIAGLRTSLDAKIKRYARSGSSLSSEGTISNNLGYQIDSAAIGFLNDGTTQYRSGFFNTNTGASGTVYGANELGATNYSANNTAITASNQNIGCNLNNTGKMLGGYYYNTSSQLNLQAVDITWNSASAPTFSAGSAALTSYTGTTGTAWYPVSGFTTDTAYILCNNSTSTIDYIPVTVSGTTISLGTTKTMFTGLSGFNYEMTGTSAKVGTKTYLAGIQIRTSGGPYVFGYRLT